MVTGRVSADKEMTNPAPLLHFTNFYWCTHSAYSLELIDYCDASSLDKLTEKARTVKVV